MESDDTVAAVDTSASAGEPSAGAATTGTQRYRFGDVIGRGGMGEVLSARDEQIGRTVAIKRLRGASPEAIARFRREAQVQGRLEHPAVVPVHELGHDERGPFFVMKQLAGVTLAEVIAKLAAGDAETARGFTRQRLLRAFTDICLAIELAHTRGIVHRDLKPANIILGEFGEVYVLDWGIARVLRDKELAHGLDGLDSLSDGETAAGAILGTPGYMSPEQIAGDETLDGRADVYALGCILFEILAHAPLHPHGRAGLASAVAGVDARPSRLASDVPPELDAACVAAVAPRDGRIASARALGERVQRFLDGDRDLALRKDLGRAELAIARAAFASGQRRDAMQAAARALALDPTSREPAELVGRLMLEPPAEAPPEVEIELAQIDLAAVDSARTLIFWTSLSYLTVFPILYWIGFRSYGYFAGCGAIAIAMALLAKLAKNTQMMYAAVIGNLLMLVALSRLLTPFLFAPGIGVIVIMAAAAHPRYVKLPLMVPLAIAATLVPFLIDQLGGAGQQVAIVGNRLELTVPAPALDPPAALASLAIYIVMMFATAGWLASAQANARRAAQRTVQIQSWQLRQLVPG